MERYSSTMDLRAVVEEARKRAKYEQASESERLRMCLDFSEDFKDKLFAIDSGASRWIGKGGNYVWIGDHNEAAQHATSLGYRLAVSRPIDLHRGIHRHTHTHTHTHAHTHTHTHTHTHIHTHTHTFTNTKTHTHTHTHTQYKVHPLFTN
jgi:hypothetical protein